MKIIRLSTFNRSAKKADLSESMIADLAKSLARNPTMGDLVQGTGGVRKMRLAMPGKGKSGGARVIHFAHLSDDTVYLILVYKKNIQANLSAQQKKTIKRLIQELKS